MRSTLGALRFLAANTVLPASDAAGEEIELALPGREPVIAERYEAPGRAAGLILFMHGMSPVGRRDPRMRRASRALAAAGFRVLTPTVPDFEALRVDVGTTDHVEACIRGVHARQDLTGGRPFGLFSVSYSAAISLLASTRDGVAPMLSAICALGTFSDAVSWARYLMSDEGADEYARLIIFQNLLHCVTGRRPAVDHALSVALRDNWHQRAEPELKAVLAGLSPEDRELVVALREDPATWRRLGAEVIARQGAVFEALNVRDQASRLRVPTMLLHGSGDNVIPAEESRALHAAMVAAGAPSRLVVTPLLGHGDAALRLRDLPEAVDVVGGFREFFRRVAEGAQ